MEKKSSWDEDVLKRLGANLRSERTLLGLTVEALEERSGISSVTISKAENGGPITMITFLILCATLAVDPASMLEERQ